MNTIYQKTVQTCIGLTSAWRHRLVNRSKIGGNSSNSNAQLIRNKSTKRRRNRGRSEKSQKIRDAINSVKKLEIEGSKDSAQKILPKDRPKIRGPTAIQTAVQDGPSPKVNAFLFVGLFPMLIMGTLTYFNDDIRKDFFKTFGIDGATSTNGSKEETQKQKS